MGGYPARGVPCQGGTLPGGYPAGGYPAGGYPAGGYPARGGTLPGGYPAGGVPCRGVPCQGVPCWGGTLLGGTLPGRYPARGVGVPCWGRGEGEGGTLLGGVPCQDGGGLTSLVSKLQMSSSAVSWPYVGFCPMELWVMLQSIMGVKKKKIMGWVPPPCEQTNKVKLLPSRRTTYAGGKNTARLLTSCVFFNGKKYSSFAD